MMERLNSGELKIIFRNILCILQHWSDEMWQNTMAKRLRPQEKISVLYWFSRNNFLSLSSSKSFTTQSHWSYFKSQCHYSGRFRQVQSIYIPSSIHHWYREVKFWAKDRQYSFCLWIPWTKTRRILTRSTWKHRVLHNKCIKHARDIKIRCVGSTSTLLWIKYWSSIKHDRTLLHETLPAYGIPKVVRMETGEVFYEKGFCVTSSSSKDFLQDKWMKDLGSEVVKQSNSSQ